MVRQRIYDGYTMVVQLLETANSGHMCREFQAVLVSVVRPVLLFGHILIHRIFNHCYW